MKKLFSIVALLAVMLVASSGFNGSVNVLSVGDKAPQLSVSDSDSSFDLALCGGEFVLLTFWSSADAQSRIDCNRYSSWFKSHTHANIKHVAINFDSQTALFDEIVRLDNLDSKAQYNVNGLAAENMRLGFGLDQGYGSVLVGPDGRVMAFNPSTTELSSL